MGDFKMLINGELVSAPETFGVINPSTAQEFGRCPKCDKQLFEGAVAAAKSAFKTWRLTSFDERKQCLTGAMAKIKENMPKIAEVLTKEQGKP
jgi:acyl-CoA reductase-like NAD-dependent aldehyde dehydrogenase